MFTFPRLLVFAALIVSGAQADTCGAVKSVPFHTFMNSSLFANVPLSVLIPAEYQFANLNAAPPTYSYLMTPEGAEAVRKTGDLPVSTGFNFGKISTDVGYDAAMDVFIGAEGLESQAKAAGFTDVSFERATEQRPCLDICRNDRENESKKDLRLVRCAKRRNKCHLHRLPRTTQ